MVKLIGYDIERKKMLSVIREEARETFMYTGKKAFDERILKVMGSLPRHEFIPRGVRAFAYDNSPVYIGHGQTISQPYIVALMTDLLSPEPFHKVLDIGTGSGYQAAILSRLVDKVYSMEIVRPLAEKAIQRFHDLEYDNIDVKVGDGYDGWPEKAPFDSIIVAAATPVIPIALVRQLKPGGVLVLPLGEAFNYQQLVAVHKSLQGEISTRYVLPVSFVPMVGYHRNDTTL